MLIINIAGLLLIALISWWFWLYKPKDVAAPKDGQLTITVENGVYSPAHIQLVADTVTTIKFLRKDGSPCAETVQFPDLEISESLPLNKVKAIDLPPLAAGVYAFHCQMQMYRGELKVQ